jgi:hypothetical protein
MRKITSAAVAAWLALSIALIGSAPAFADNQGLGIAIQVIQGKNDSSKDLNKNNRLWFVIAPGKSGSRDFQIRSASDIPQKIHLAIGAQKQVNGVRQYDPEGTTPASAWATFSNNDFVLAPRMTSTLTMTISVPQNTGVQTLQPSLLVQASAVKSASTQYKVPTALQFSQDIFLGVGTSDQFLTKFSIDDVRGANTNDGHVLIVKLSNSGKTPVALTGDLQLNNLTFAGVTVGPLQFVSPSIQPGDSAEVPIKVDEKVTESKWQILVRAQQGSIQETRTFEQDISFKGTNYLQLAITSSIIILISLAVLMVAIRTLRSIKRKQLEEQRAKDEAEAERIAEAARVAELERQLAEMQAALVKPKPRRKPTTKAKTKPKAD